MKWQMAGFSREWSRTHTHTHTHIYPLCIISDGVSQSICRTVASTSEIEFKVFTLNRIAFASIIDRSIANLPSAAAAAAAGRSSPASSNNDDSLFVPLRHATLGSLSGGAKRRSTNHRYKTNRTREGPGCVLWTINATTTQEVSESHAIQQSL